MTPLQWHTSNSHIYNGIDQAKRKSIFFEKYRVKLLERYPDIMEKEIIPIVVTNYPLHAGRNNQGVAVLDFNLLYNILTNAPLTKLKLVVETIETTVKDYYYKNEDDFNNRIHEILNNPLPLAEMQRETDYRDIEIPLLDGDKKFITRHYFTKRIIPEINNSN